MDDINSVQQESKINNKFIIPLVIALIILIIAIFFVFRFQEGTRTSFNIPTDLNHVIFIENNNLYGFNPLNEKVRKLGTFKIDSDINEIAISSDLKIIALASEGEIFRYTSFSDGKMLADQGEDIENIAISPNGLILFSSGSQTSKGELSVYSVLDNDVRLFANGRTPFFLRSGTRAAISVEGGFRLFDFEAKDSLITEKPLLSLANTAQATLSGDTLALISVDDQMVVYDILTSRPLSIVENYKLKTKDVYDISANDDGLVAFLSVWEGIVYLSVHDSVTRERVSTGLPLKEGAKIVTWSQ